MLSIPIQQETFEKSFLDGRGNLELGTDQDIWNALWESKGRFTRDIDKVAALSLSAGTGDKDLKLGQSGNVSLTVSAGGQAGGEIRLIWPNDDGDQDAAESNELIATYGLGSHLVDGQLYVAFILNGSAQAGASGNVPSGALSASFWGGAGGSAEYTRLKPYADSTKAKQILTDVLKTTRLPQKIDSIGEIPEEGEVVALTHGGYLYLGAQLNWGYQMNGVKSFSPGELDLTFSYLVKMAAQMRFDYKMAGYHTIQARRGHAENWVRFVVNKTRDRDLGFAADFGIDATADVEGLPDNVDDFLAAFLGTDVRSALGYVQQIRKFDTMEEIEAKLDSLARNFVDELSEKWIGEVLKKDTVARFFEQAQEVVEAYDSVDQKVLGLYERYLDKIPELTEKIDDLARITTQEGLISLVEGEVPEGIVDSKAWELAKEEWGDDFYDLLFDVKEFSEFRDFVGKAQSFLNGGAQQKISDFIADAKEKLGLDGIVDKLRAVDTPEELQDLADKKLQGFVSRILDKAFNELEESELADAVVTLKTFLDNIDNFKNKWYGKLKASAHQSLSMQVAYNYTRTRKNHSLLDVEVNLGHTRGPDLARAATKGDFRETLKAYDPAVVRINKGSGLTQNLQKSSQLQVNVFGRSYSRAVQFVQNLDQYVESENGGLLHVFALDTTSEVERKKIGSGGDVESRQSSFLLQSLGASFQEAHADVPQDAQGRFLVNTLRSMAVKYAMTQEDQATTWVEMRRYLGLAEELQLIQSAEKVNAQLRQELGAEDASSGPGNVKVDYVIRFDDRDLRTLFSVYSGDDDAMVAAARETARAVIGQHFLSFGPADNRYGIGAAYLQGRREVPSRPERVRLVFAQGDSLSVEVSRNQRILSNRLVATEEGYVEKLSALDELVDGLEDANASVPIDDLKKASADFVKLNAKLEKILPGERGVNAFFIIFDRLVRETTRGRARRKAAMIVTITPPGATSDEEKVTKFFVDEGASQASQAL